MMVYLAVLGAGQIFFNGVCCLTFGWFGTQLAPNEKPADELIYKKNAGPAFSSVMQRC